MIDFINTPPFLRIVLQVAMATMQFHIAQAGLFMGIFFHIQGSQETILHQFKIVLGCKVGQSRSQGRWFKV